MLEKHNLYFISSRNEYRLLKRNVTWDECFTLIGEFLKEHNFTWYYTRTWSVDEGMMFDVGSHTEFFLWGGKDDNKC